MIKKSRVKYLGVAAAALLAVAPAVTTAVSPAFAGNNISTVQAATTGVSGEFTLSGNGTWAFVKNGSKIFTDSSLKTDSGKTTGLLDHYIVVGANLQNGSTTSLRIASDDGKTIFGWINATSGDTNVFTSFLGTGNQTFTIPDTTYYKITNGAVFNATQLTLDNKGQAVEFVDANKATAKATDLITNNPLSETKDSSYLLPNNNSAQIYTDAATSIKSTSPATMTAPATAKGIVKYGDKVVAYKLADNQYVAAGDVTLADPANYIEDTNILASKSQVIAKGSTATVYSDKTTQTPVTTGDKTINNTDPQKVLAYVRPAQGATAVALKIGDGRYVKVSDIKYYTDASSGLTTDTDVPASKSVAKTKGTDKVQVYSDPAATQAMDGNLITPGNPYKVIGIVSDADGNVVSYMLAPGQYVKAGDVTVSGDGSTTGNYTEFLENGSVNVKKDATVYSDNNFATAEDTKITKGQTINYTSVLKANDTGKILGYGFKNGDHTSYIKVADTGDTVDTNLTITVVPAGTLTVDSANKAVKVYDDAATSKDSGATLDTSYNTWTVTRTAKNSDGKVVAYDLGNNQWVKAADVTEGSTASKATVSDLPTGTALYSNFMGATIYSDPDTTKSNGSLNTSYDEWSAFKVAKDSNGNPVAYELGSNQWVKASDLQLQKNLNGTFDANAGTALYSSDGTLTGTISSSGLYKVFAVTYINGHQAVKLGNDSQWIIAATGDYYPA